MTSGGPYRAGPAPMVQYGADRCQGCGAEIPLLSRVLGRHICVGCESRANQARGAFLQYAYQCLDDGLLSPEEEANLLGYQAQLGLTNAHIADVIPALVRGKAFWSLSQGQLPVVDRPPMLLAGGETCHAVAGARLLEEHTVRVRVGQSQGYSVRISKHIRVRQGASRGVSVPMTELVPVGSGLLCVTSERIVFMGPRTIEIKLSKLLGVEAYRDGVEPQYPTNRKKRQVFAVEDGEWLSNVMLVAAQLFAERPASAPRRRR